MIEIVVATIVVILVIFAFTQIASLELFPKRGIVFFDIDNTLTDMPERDRESMIVAVTNAGYDIGIITASMRPKHYLVNEDGTPNLTASPWMSTALAKILVDTDFKTFNTLEFTAGKYSPIFRSPDPKTFGWRKGLQMKTCIRNGNYNVKKSYLFDDQQLVLTAAKEKCPGARFVIVNNRVPELSLTTDRIMKILS
jgi:hypothetical protein